MKIRIVNQAVRYAKVPWKAGTPRRKAVPGTLKRRQSIVVDADLIDMADLKRLCVLGSLSYTTISEAPRRTKEAQGSGGPGDEKLKKRRHKKKYDTAPRFEEGG
jgi:hypothetical protein